MCPKFSLEWVGTTSPKNRENSGNNWQEPLEDPPQKTGCPSPKRPFWLDHCAAPLAKIIILHPYMNLVGSINPFSNSIYGIIMLIVDSFLFLMKFYDCPMHVGIPLRPELRWFSWPPAATGTQATSVTPWHDAVLTTAAPSQPISRWPVAFPVFF